MNESIYEQLQQHADILGLSMSAAWMAGYADEHKLSAEQLAAICEIFEELRIQKEENTVNMLLRLSRLPIKSPKTFEGFDFSRIHGKHIAEIRNLPLLSAIYARKNLAFIGSQGIGKTHLAMAYGRACCEKKLKTYFLKATELNQKLVDAVKYGREKAAIQSLVKPSCLIIDEVGRCVFNTESTRMFFDFIDRRYSKDGPNTTIFTSNVGPDKWKDFFSGSDDLLCSLDRIFDVADVFMMKGESYRGRKLQTYAIDVGDDKTAPNKQ